MVLGSAILSRNFCQDIGARCPLYRDKSRHIKVHREILQPIYPSSLSTSRPEPMALETNIPIGGAQQRIEKLPAGPLQLPKEGGPFILDQSVIDGMYVS
jgi:hypothetical protein